VLFFNSGGTTAVKEPCHFEVRKSSSQSGHPVPDAAKGSPDPVVEHSNSRFESIRYANRLELIRLVKKSAFRFTSCHAVFSCLFIVQSQPKNKLTSVFAAFNTLDVFNLLEIV